MTVASKWCLFPNCFTLSCLYTQRPVGWMLLVYWLFPSCLLLKAQGEIGSYHGRAQLRWPVCVEARDLNIGMTSHFQRLWTAPRDQTCLASLSFSNKHQHSCPEWPKWYLKKEENFPSCSQPISIEACLSPKPSDLWVRNKDSVSNHRS